MSAEIEENYSYGYPLSAVSAHVSACPNHQTLQEYAIRDKISGGMHLEASAMNATSAI